MLHTIVFGGECLSDLNQNYYYPCLRTAALLGLDQRAIFYAGLTAGLLYAQAVMGKGHEIMHIPSMFATAEIERRFIQITEHADSWYAGWSASEAICQKYTTALFIDGTSISIAMGGWPDTPQCDDVKLRQPGCPFGLRA